jgi:CubicO group peptidase (beta-lactamase class C family)
MPLRSAGLRIRVFESSNYVRYDASMTQGIRFNHSLPFIVIAALSCALPLVAQAQPVGVSPATEARIQALVPDLEAYANNAMQTFGVPGFAIGIVSGDRLVYAKGFGVRSKAGGTPVDSHTVFQIGSTTKAFLAATQGIMVDRGKFRWDDRVVDLYPEFQLKDPWVTREFRVFDLLAQRSGLPPYVNDALGFIGLDAAAMVHSLRYVEPVSSFRTTFAYTNITHVLAGLIVAKAAGAPDWNAVLQKELLDPLGMRDSSYTAAAIAAAPNHAEGYRWAPTGMTELPFTQVFPYDYGGAGDLNSNVEDMAHWVRLQLTDGSFEGKRIVSAESMAATRTPKVAASDKAFYALGWIVQQTPNGNIVWHNGGTSGFGSYVGLLLDKGVGIVILANAVGFPDAIGSWAMDRLLGNPQVDHTANLIKAAMAKYDATVKMFAKPEHPRPFPPLAPLAGRFANPSIGKASVTVEGDTLVVEITATGAKLKLEPWDGDVFTARLMPLGRFATIAEDLGPLPAGFVQPRIDKKGELNVLRLSLDDGQAYEFVRD